MIQENKVKELIEKFIKSLIEKDICTLDGILSPSVEIDLLNMKIKYKLNLIDLIQNEDLIFKSVQITSIIQLNDNNTAAWLKAKILTSLGTSVDQNLRVCILCESNQFLISSING